MNSILWICVKENVLFAAKFKKSGMIGTAVLAAVAEKNNSTIGMAVYVDAANQHGITTSMNG